MQGQVVKKTPKNLQNVAPENLQNVTPEFVHNNGSLSGGERTEKEKENQFSNSSFRENSRNIHNQQLILFGPNATQ